MDLDSSKRAQTKSENALAERLAKRASRHLVNKTDKDAFKPAMGLAFLGALGWNIPIPTFWECCWAGGWTRIIRLLPFPGR